MSYANKNSRRLQNGVALIAVLWVLAFLATIASTVAHQSRTSLQMTKNRIEQLKLKQAAESAILISIANIINTPSKQTFQRMDNVFKGISIDLSVLDESGKIDINTAPIEILRSLFSELGLEEEAALNMSNAIIDWRDEDSLAREGGAEDREYLLAGYQYQSKDADFERIEELQLVYGMTPVLYELILPHITVHTYDYGVNLSVASKLVQRAVENSSNFNVTDLDESAIEDEDLDEFTSLTEGYIYTFKANANNQSGMTQALSAIIRIERGNIYEPFTVLSWQSGN